MEKDLRKLIFKTKQNNNIDGMLLDKAMIIDSESLLMEYEMILDFNKKIIESELIKLLVIKSKLILEIFDIKKS